MKTMIPSLKQKSPGIGIPGLSIFACCQEFYVVAPTPEARARGTLAVLIQQQAHAHGGQEVNNTTSKF